MTNFSQCCDLDDQTTQYLLQWKAELAAIENSVNLKAATVQTIVDKAEASSETSATCIFTTPSLNHRAIFTWLTPGVAGNSWSISLLPKFPLEASLSHEIDSTNKVISFFLEVDASGNIVTTPLSLKTYVGGTAELSALISVTDPDTILPSTSDPLSFNYLQFTGGNDAPLTTITKNLNSLFASRGENHQSMLQNINVPIASTPFETLAELTGLIVLPSGKTFRISGNNLIEIRSLWEILTENTSSVLSYLSEPSGTPIVIWFKTVTTTIPSTPCQSAESETVATQEIVAINSKPSETATPSVWWLDNIDTSVGNLSKLKKYGISQSQLVNLLDQNDENTHLIVDKDIFFDNDLLVSDVSLILNLDFAEGISTISYLESLQEVSEFPVGIETGYLIPQFNYPIEKLREQLSLDQSYFDLIRTSVCIDPLAKSGLTTVFSAFNAAMDTIARIIAIPINLVRSVLNKVGSILAAIQKFLKEANAALCLGLGNLDAPTIIDVKAKLEPCVAIFDELIDTIMDIFKDIYPSACKITKALMDLVGPLDKDLECFTKGLTNFIVNRFGIVLKKFLPCIRNPLDYLSMVADCLDRCNMVTFMINGLLSNLASFQRILDSFNSIQDEELFQQTTEKCNSLPLETLVKRNKKLLGI